MERYRSIESIDDAPNNHIQEQPRPRFSLRDMIILANFALSNFFVGAFYSLIFAFFVDLAGEKGLTPSIAGVIVGMYELGVLIASPICGKYITTFGAKFLFVGGLIFCGVFCLLFGFIDYFDKIGFLVTGLLLRLLEGLSGGTVNTASFAIAGLLFPDHIGSIFGTLELFSGFGMMVGPILGGILKDHGGYYLPFVISGSLLILLGLGSLWMLPSVHNRREEYEQIGEDEREASMFKLAIDPTVLISSLLIMIGTAAINFTSLVLMDEILDGYDLGSYGYLFYLCGPAAYMVMSSVFGRLSDLYPRSCEYILSAGFIVTAICLFMLGPAKFFHFDENQEPLGVIIAALLLQGIGISTVVVVFKIMKLYTIANNYPDNQKTSGIIPALFWSYFSMGALVGPFIGGFIKQRYELSTAMESFGSASLIVSVILLMYTTIQRGCAYCRRANYDHIQDLNINA